MTRRNLSIQLEVTDYDGDHPEVVGLGENTVLARLDGRVVPLSLTDLATALDLEGGSVTQQDIDDAIAALVDGAPALLDTLNELAAALDDDADLAGTLTALIATAQATADNHVADATAAHAGTAIANTPAGNVAATTVQAAINELDTEKAKLGLVGSPVEIGVALSDETTTITTGNAKATIRLPFAMTLTAVRASVNTVSSSGLPTVDINLTGTGTILSTKLTIDASELTSTTAATAPVISTSALADDAELTFDIDVAGTGAKGLKVWLIGTRA